MTSGSPDLARSARRFRRVHHAAGALVVAGWAATMGSLLLSRLASRGAAPDRPLSALLGKTAETRTFGVYHGTTKIGYSASRRARTAGGWLFADQAVWDMALQGSRQHLVANTEALVGDDFALKSFKADVDAGVAHIKVDGRVEGNELVLSFETAGRHVEDRQALTGSVMLPALVRPAVAARALAPGKSFTFEIFNPMARGVETVDVAVEDRETLHTAIGDVETWRIDEILRGSIKTQVWIDENGETVREVSPLGMRIEVEPREMAIALPDSSTALPDLITAVRVPVKGDLPAQIARGRVAVHLGGIDPKEFPLLGGGRQYIGGDRLTVDSTRVAVPWTLPYVGGDQGPSLAAEPLVQSTDAEIVATAKRITAGATDAVDASRRINTWVHDNLVKENVAGVPSAVEVLQTKRGDCNEHTTLFVALARAVGIPARMAVGVVWANARGAGPGLYYHAWPEVYLGRVGTSMPGLGEKADGWYAVDPTLGQFPADAGHLRFLVGGLERQVDLLKLIGHLSVVVDDGHQEEK